MNSVIWAAGGTGFTFLMTTLGAAMVFFFRGKVNDGIQRIFLGFAAGVMIFIREVKSRKEYRHPGREQRCLFLQ